MDTAFMKVQQFGRSGNIVQAQLKQQKEASDILKRPQILPQGHTEVLFCNRPIFKGYVLDDNMCNLDAEVHNFRL